MKLARFPIGPHATRPAFSDVGPGMPWFSTDLAGGTLFIATAAGWVALAPGVLEGAGGPVYAELNVDFGAGVVDAVIVTVADTAVTAATTITGSFEPGPGRSLDELEMESLGYSVVVTPGVGFNVTVTCLTGGAEGVYVFRYAKGD